MVEPVLYEQNSGVVTLTLNSPETRNALSPDIVDALVACCERVNRDMSVLCVIVTGAGKGFSSGGNIKEMHQRTGMFAGTPAEVRRAYQNGIQRVPIALHNIEVPTIAAVNGHAVGAGCDLSLMCDIRICAEDAQFAESFMRMGLVSGDGGAWFLPRIVGLSKAYEMTYTGDFIGASQALSWGLVSRIVPSALLMTEAMALAQKIAAQPPQSLRLCRKLLREALSMELSPHLEMVAGMQAIVQHTADQQEAVNAYFDKRKPQFRGV